MLLRAAKGVATSVGLVHTEARGPFAQGSLRQLETPRARLFGTQAKYESPGIEISGFLSVNV